MYQLIIHIKGRRLIPPAGLLPVMDMVSPGSSLLPTLKGISAEFQVIRGFSQKILADLLSYDKIHS